MSRTALSPLSPVLESHTLIEARECLLDLDEKFQIIPPASREALLAATDTLIQHAEALPLTQLDKITENASHLIGAASGVARDRHTQFLAAVDAQPLHLHRNVLLALVLAAVITYRGDADPIAAAFPVLQPRTIGRPPRGTARPFAMLRPNTDDEALLLRMWALHLSGGDKNNRRAAAVFAQCDAGLAAGETTRVNADDVVLEPDEGLIHAPGHSVGVAPRTLNLDNFGVEILSRYVAGDDVTRGPYLTYRPRANTKCAAAPKHSAAKYAAACASAIGVVDRIRKAVGLKHADTTSASIWMWRVATTATLEGVRAAVEVSGRSDEANLHGLLDNGTKTYQKPRPNKPRTLEDL